ncbi:hypothetical protein DL96DRAFT_1455552 [Flagelloscypha sp. PMI_526]|nr:hypothetical protein DL96DRAFT_1455552 [Flagelloscypha sp. PMI_526]
MSAAETQRIVESHGTPEDVDSELLDMESPSLAKLRTLDTPGNTAGVIAVDLDDVLCATNDSIARWHNRVYGTNMQIKDFYYYYYWKNPYAYWGDIPTTMKKVTDYYTTGAIFRDTHIVPGAREGIQTLRDMNFRLDVVTARTESFAEESWKWLDKHFPNMFNSIICTGQFKDAHKDGGVGAATKLSKAQVCKDLGAVLLIDDSAENATQCGKDGSFKVLLFGDYPWNKRLSGPMDSTESQTYDVRLQIEGGREFWKDDEEKLVLPDGVERVRDWGETVKWVKKNLC